MLASRFGTAARPDAIANVIATCRCHVTTAAHPHRIHVPVALRIARPRPITQTTPARISWRRAARAYSQRQPNRPSDHRSPEERLRDAQPLFQTPVRVLGRFSARIDRLTHRISTRTLVLSATLAAVVFYVANSQTVPVSGRRRFNFLGDSLLNWIGASTADAVLRDIENEGKRLLPERDRRTIAVRRVMERLIPVSGMAHVDWKIHVIDDESTVNAFVTPGGHLFVFSGIIRVCRSVDALAAVLGHEIAHNTAAHAAERMSAAFAGNLLSGSLFLLAGPLKGIALMTVWSISGGRYLQQILSSLPMGRKMESEADYIGLMMMAEACFDPRAAVGYWERMNQLSQRGGAEIPEMLSTHPSNSNRIEKMKEWMPEALEKRAKSDCQGTSAWAKDFRESMLQRQLIRI